MNKTLLLVPLILSVGITPAFGQVFNEQVWTGIDDISHLSYEFNCRSVGDGIVTVNFYPDYVHFEFRNTANNGGSDEYHQRIFSYQDYNEDIVPYYMGYLGGDSSKC